MGLTWVRKYEGMEGQLGERIVDKLIKKMQPPEKGNRLVWDSEIPSFGVCVTAAGAKSFILDYQSFGRQRRYTLGRHPEWTATAAREEVLALKRKIRDGFDPQEEKRKARLEPTVGELADEYMQSDRERKKRATSVRNDKQMLESNIRPAIGKMALKAVGRRDIEKLHSSLNDTPYQANRVLALLSTIFNYAIQEKRLTENPAKGIEKFEETKRECWLDDEKLQRFRQALDSYGNEIANNQSVAKKNAEKQRAANALKLLMLTGSRAGEVLKAEWEQFDLVRARWTKPSINTKQKKVEHVPLSAPAVELMISMMPRNPTGPLFPGRNGGMRVSLKRPWLQACRAAGFVEVETVQGKRRLLKRFKPTLRIHDLRHNYASYLVNNGESLQTVSKLLGHSQTATTERYAHIADQTLRIANDKFALIYTNAAKRKTA
jgi:integrase